MSKFNVLFFCRIDVTELQLLGVFIFFLSGFCGQDIFRVEVNIYAFVEAIACFSLTIPFLHFNQLLDEVKQNIVIRPWRAEQLFASSFGIGKESIYSPPKNNLWLDNFVLGSVYNVAFKPLLIKAQLCIRMGVHIHRFEFCRSYF